MNQSRFQYFITLVVLSAAILIRLTFALYKPYPQIYDDSLGYYRKGLQVIENPKLENLISDFRTPLYPIFLALTIKNQPEYSGKIHTWTELEHANGSTMVIQQIIGVVGILLLAWILFRLKLHNILVFVISLIVAVDVLVLYWERSFMTEGLTPAFLIIYFYFLLRLISTKKTKDFFLLWISFTAIFLLRPSMVLLPFVTLPIVFSSAAKKLSEKVKIMGTLAACALIIIVYMTGNRLYHNYAGIQRAGDVNLMSRLLLYKIPMKENDAAYYKTVVDNYDTTEWSEIPHSELDGMRKYAYSVFISNMPLYTFKSLTMIPEIITKDADVITKHFSRISVQQNYYLNMLFVGLLYVYNQMLHFTPVIFFLYPVSFYLMITNTSIKTTFLFALGTFIMSQIITLAFDSYVQDYGRLTTPLQPLLLFFIVAVSAEIFQKIKSKWMF